MAVKSGLKIAAIAGTVLSLISLAAHLLLARFFPVEQAQNNYNEVFNLHESTRIQNNATLTSQATQYGKVWGQVKSLRGLHPHAGPREYYPAPSWPGQGFIFSDVKGEFHNIRVSICDLVAIARLLNATLVIPSLRAVSLSKGISPSYRGFNYLYDEQHFIAALAEDVRVVKKLPKQLRLAKKKRLLPVRSPPRGAAPDYYLEKILPEMKEYGAIGLLVPEGGCLQSVLPAELAEFQRLRCRVAFHALRFRQEIHDLGMKMVSRLQARGQPYLAIHPGLERDAMAFHGCAECFQDVQTESIQYKRQLMINASVVKGQLNVSCEQQRAEGLCPLMPGEMGALLRALGFGKDTRLYISGAEIFGGQRVLLPLRAMFSQMEDRTTITTDEELFNMYGQEDPIPPPPPPPPEDPEELERLRLEAWAKAGPRPRPLPPPAGRPKYPHEIQGWWGWIGESEKEPPPTLQDTRDQGHRLLWAALDYTVCTEANAFLPGFDADRSGRPNFASLVMGHRAYATAALKTYRPDRKLVFKSLQEIEERLHNPGKAWMLSAREMLNQSSGPDGLARYSLNIKPRSFISHPFPECVCRSPSKLGVFPPIIHDQSASTRLTLFGDEELCPEWMKQDTLVEWQAEEEIDFFDESVLNIEEGDDDEISGDAGKDEDEDVPDDDMELED